MEQIDTTEPAAIPASRPSEIIENQVINRAQNSSTEIVRTIKIMYKDVCDIDKRLGDLNRLLMTTLIVATLSIVGSAYCIYNLLTSSLL